MSDTACLLAPEPTQSPRGHTLRPRSPSSPQEGYVIPSPDGRLRLPSQQFDFSCPSPSRRPCASTSSHHQPASSSCHPASSSRQATSVTEDQPEEPLDAEEEADTNKRRQAIWAGKQRAKGNSTSNKKRMTNVMRDVSGIYSSPALLSFHSTDHFLFVNFLFISPHSISLDLTQSSTLQFCFMNNSFNVGA